MPQEGETRWAALCPVCGKWVVCTIGDGIGPDAALVRLPSHQHEGRECDGTQQAAVQVKPLTGSNITLNVGEIVPVLE